MDLIHRMRAYVLPTLAGLTLLFLVLWASVSGAFFWPLLVTAPLLALGIHDVVQRKHSILRNYPVLGHMRFLLEGVGPEIRQYFVESNSGGRPFDRDKRTLMYERSKGIEGLKPFGTELDVYETGYGFISHSVLPKQIPDDPARDLRVEVGGPECSQPYRSSLINISAMSFGALSANAQLALNTAARRGGFAHNTGEGGYSRYHRQPGGDIIWQIGTGYFGCRNSDGGFDIGTLRGAGHQSEQIKMIELKISQGAKPGHGGILPGIKVTEEIAEARKRAGRRQDCFSPPAHSAFSTPIGPAGASSRAARSSPAASRSASSWRWATRASSSRSARP